MITVDLLYLENILRSAEQCLLRDSVDDAIHHLEDGIKILDEAYELTDSTRSDRSRMQEEHKNYALRFWLRLFEAKLQWTHQQYDPLHSDNDPMLLAENLTNSIDELVKCIDCEISSYKCRNCLHTTNMLYLTYQRLAHDLIQKGRIETATRIRYHKMVARTKLHFYEALQGKSSPGKRLSAFIRGLLLTFLWWSSDFGESALKYTCFVLLTSAGFAVFYAFAGTFDPPLLFSSIWHRIGFGTYTSFITLFTLGGNQIVPGDGFTSAIVLLEFVLGYVFLGLLVAILTRHLLS